MLLNGVAGIIPSMKDSKMRLDKFLTMNGFASRRDGRKFLKANELSVNGVVIKDPETKIYPEKDRLILNGEELSEPNYVYYALNKPKNVISTTADELGREDVTSFIDTPRMIYPIGRLDKDTTGLILLTDDGELTHQLTHPRYHVPKTYLLTIEGDVTEEQLETFRTGVPLKDGKTLPAEVSLIPQKNEQTILQMTIHEGRNRQIRRMCEKVGIELIDLQRVSFGPISLEDLPEGEYRELREEEIKNVTRLYKCLG